jgi:phosphoglycolate phosphatase-like HAD superfamily hydrolase
VRSSNGKRPVVGLDIDGTLGDYHGHFLKFAEGWIGKKMPRPDEINPGLPLHKFMAVSKQTYRQCKLAYRQGGLKRSMPAYDGARELTVAIRKTGAEVWIATTRPYLRLDNIDPDTRHWLRRNGIQYDAVLWGEHKYRDLVRQAGVERVVCVMDDLRELTTQATRLGMDAILRDQPYNRTEEKATEFWYSYRAWDLEDARISILEYIDNWKENQKKGLDL